MESRADAISNVVIITSFPPQSDIDSAPWVFEMRAEFTHSAHYTCDQRDVNFG